MNTFAEDGLTFSYPENWPLELDRTEDGWTATVQSPGAAFMMVRLDRTLPPVEEVVEATLRALQEDYPKLESESALESVAGEPAYGHEASFFHLDMLNTLWTRCFYGPAGTVLVLCQASSADQNQNELVLRAMCASMRAAEETE